MQSRKLILWGTGGHAGVVAEIAALLPQWELVGFWDDAAVNEPQTFRGLPVLAPYEAGQFGFDDSLKESIAVVVAIGHCAVRLRLLRELLDKGWQTATLIHPTAIISPSAQIGPGSMICAGSIVGTGAKLGVGCLINTAASVDHDCVLGNGVHICPGTHLAGNVTIGEGSWIGIGTSVIEQRTIGARTKVGAGSVVTRDLPGDVIAWGSPAKVQRSIDS